MFTRHHLRSLNFALLILAGFVGLTAFGATQRADATPNPVASAQRATAVPALHLQRPADNACATGAVTFSWLWQGTTLAGNQGFEVRLWKEKKVQHVRLATPASSNSQHVDLRRAPVVRQGGTGPYLWSVAMVQLSPYRQIGKETSPRKLYIDLTKPANAPCIVQGSPTDTPGVAPTDTVGFVEVNPEPEPKVSRASIRISGATTVTPTLTITDTPTLELMATDTPIDEPTDEPVYTP